MTLLHGKGRLGPRLKQLHFRCPNRCPKRDRGAGPLKPKRNYPRRLVVPGIRQTCQLSRLQQIKRDRSHPIASRCSNSVASSGNLVIAFVGFFLVQPVNDRYAD
jgi:hypothetical protein